MIVNKIGIAFSIYGGPLHFNYELGISYLAQLATTIGTPTPLTLNPSKKSDRKRVKLINF